MGNSLSGVAPAKRTKETDFYDGGNRFRPDYEPPRESISRPIVDSDPMFRKSSAAGSEDARLSDAVQAVDRMQKMDCISSTLQFVQYPALVGALYGATQASSQSQKSLASAAVASGRAGSGGLFAASRSLMQEARFLWRPVAVMAGYSGLYSVASCALAKQYFGYDGIGNSAGAGLLTGMALGAIQFRCPNRMFIFGFWGAAIAALSKWELLNDTLSRPIRTYYELIDNRKENVRFLDKDGYRHEYLDPKLRQMGLRVPESWDNKTQ